MKYKCVIADDSMLERDLLQMLLLKTGLVDIVAACSDGMQAYHAITRQEVDLVVTDIDMPEMNGLELVKSLKQQPVFIFVSAHKEYASDGFDLDVADFILKPLQIERLLRALDKAGKMISLKRQDIVAMPPITVDDEQHGHFFIRVADGLVQLHHSMITHIESAGNFSKVFTTNGDAHLTLISLKSLLLQLPKDWMIRVHRQYAVNIRHITNVEQASVKLGGVITLPLTRQYRQDLVEKVASKTLHRGI